jgi:hypothetical protein
VAWDHCAAYQKPVNPKFNIVSQGVLGLGHNTAPILTQSNPSLEQPIALTNFQEAEHKRLSTSVIHSYTRRRSARVLRVQMQRGHPPPAPGGSDCIVPGDRGLPIQVWARR